LNQKDGTRALRANQTLSCNSVKDGEGKKPKPVREESFSSKLVFEKNDFRYIDKIVDPNRRKRDGPKGYPPSSIFTALLLMYLKSMESVLELVRFLNSNPDWLVTLNLKKKIKSQIRYKVPDRSTFYKFARRLGPGKDSRYFLSHGSRAHEDASDQIKGGKGVAGLLDHSYGRGSTTASMQTVPNTTTANAKSTDTETEMLRGSGITPARSTSLAIKCI
jgi:hypothetical protein